jgi:hypothetical protein
MGRDIHLIVNFDNNALLINYKRSPFRKQQAVNTVKTGNLFFGIREQREGKPLFLLKPFESFLAVIADTENGNPRRLIPGVLITEPVGLQDSPRSTCFREEIHHAYARCF